MGLPGRTLGMFLDIEEREIGHNGRYGPFCGQTGNYLAKWRVVRGLGLAEDSGPNLNVSGGGQDLFYVDPLRRVVAGIAGGAVAGFLFVADGGEQAVER